eukprot:CAMPEP_0182417854 /NCGR_PEP_ID=MMETSP1167-20130531/2294_1 /TAXON_ID=2988 /ORGANISM="Mallomonas Sp, Strain CCMP3275" /LENGTH=378 /DNA_ID=CAMNT_0024591663 /DNA_START=152 /DNA_END=1288 /DNA_ORIENTATION=-
MNHGLLSCKRSLILNSARTSEPENSQYGEMYDSDRSQNKLPLPMKSKTQKVILKWYCMLRKLREATNNSSVHDVSRRTGISIETLQTLNSMALKFEQRIIFANMRLVRSIALKYQGSGVELDDLIGEGLKGLKRAIERFDATRGCAFSTYAYPWIKEYIRLALASANPITIPTHVYRLLVKVRGIQERLYLTLGRAPTDEDLAEEMGVEMSRLEIVRRAMALEARINERVMEQIVEEEEERDEEEGVTEPQTQELLSSNLDMLLSSQPPPTAQAGQRDARATVLQALATLPQDEAFAIYSRLGLGEGAEETQGDTSFAGAAAADEELLKALYHKGVRRLRRRVNFPEKYPAVCALEGLFRDSRVEEMETEREVRTSST